MKDIKKKQNKFLKRLKKIIKKKSGKEKEKERNVIRK